MACKEGHLSALHHCPCEPSRLARKYRTLCHGVKGICISRRCVLWGTGGDSCPHHGDQEGQNHSAHRDAHAIFTTNPSGKGYDLKEEKILARQPSMESKLGEATGMRDSSLKLFVPGGRTWATGLESPFLPSGWPRFPSPQPLLNKAFPPRG